MLELVGRSFMRGRESISVTIPALEEIVRSWTTISIRWIMKHEMSSCAMKEAVTASGFPVRKFESGGIVLSAVIRLF